MPEPIIAGEDYDLGNDHQFKGMMSSGLQKLAQICHPFMKRAGKEAFHFKGGFDTETESFEVELLVKTKKKPMIYANPKS